MSQVIPQLRHVGRPRRTGLQSIGSDLLVEQEIQGLRGSAAVGPVRTWGLKATASHGRLSRGFKARRQQKATVWRQEPEGRRHSAEVGDNFWACKTRPAVATLGAGEDRYFEIILQNTRIKKELWRSIAGWSQTSHILYC